MHLDIPHLIYSGPPIADETVLDRVPRELRTALRARNGCVAYRGAVHVRGACLDPAWHSLRAACEGPTAFPVLYPALSPDDVPFAEELFGDQFILRDGRVLRLTAETGDLEGTAESVEAWFEQLLEDVAGLLGYEPSAALARVGGKLGAGQLVSVFPPLVVDAGEQPRSFRAIDALDCRGALAAFARQIRDLPDGAPVEIKVIT
jgi:hypothetical protein